MNRTLSDIISLENPKSPVAEAYRTFRTNIQFSSFDKELKSIVITSSGPGEGKTTTTCNLAVAMAQSGKKVLLVDCDLRKSQIHKNFGLSNQQGLANILLKQLPHTEIIQRTYVENLSVLTAGPKPPNPSELLGSNAMKSFVQKITQDYDNIIFDTPPVGVVTDAAILSAIVDGTILVVASGQVAVEAARRSKALLENVNANIIGVLLNKIPLEGRSYYGYYYYHYYYDGNGEKRKAEKRKRSKAYD